MKPFQNFRSQFQFRAGTSQDWDSIIAIHNAHVRDQNHLNSQGFLLAKITKIEIIENINHHQTQYFVAVHSSQTILGFLALAHPKISEEFLNQILWKEDIYRSQILSEQHLYLKTVATHLNYQGQGVAQFLYHSLYQKFPNAFLSTFIVTQPISNIRSIRFHEQQGFYPVGTLQLESFLDLKNYESILMVKAL